MYGQLPEQEEFQAGQRHLAMSGIGHQSSEVQAEPTDSDDVAVGGRLVLDSESAASGQVCAP